MAKPVAVSDASFEAEVEQSKELVLVDFWAEWCGPCHMVAPVLEGIGNEYEGSIKIAKLDVDSNPKIQMRFGVQSIPTMILFKSGEEVERLIGYMPKDRILDRVKPHMEAPARA